MPLRLSVLGKKNCVIEGFIIKLRPESFNLFDLELWLSGERVGSFCCW